MDKVFDPFRDNQNQAPAASTPSIADPFAPGYKKPSAVGGAVKRLGGRIVQSTGQALEDVGIDSAAGITQRGRDIQANAPQYVTSIDEAIQSPGAFLKETLADAGAQVAASAGGGKVGQIAGRALGGIAGGALTRSAAGARAGAEIGGKIGAGIGGTAPLALQPYGGIRDEQAERGVDDPGLAAVASLGSAAVERLGIERAADAIVGLNAAKRAADVSRLQQAGRGAVRGALVEAPTEVLQTAIERIGSTKPLDEDLGEYAFAALAGAVGGAGIGAGVGALTPQAIEQQQDQPPGTQPPVDPTPQPPPPPPPPRGANAQLDDPDFEGFTWMGGAERQPTKKRGESMRWPVGALPAPAPADDGTMVVSSDGMVRPQTQGEAEQAKRAREQAAIDIGLTPDVVAAQQRRQSAGQQLADMARQPDAGPLTKAVGLNVENTSLGATGVAPALTGPGALEGELLAAERRPGGDKAAKSATKETGEIDPENYRRALGYPLRPEAAQKVAQGLEARGVTAEVLPHPNVPGAVMVIPKQKVERAPEKEVRGERVEAPARQPAAEQRQQPELPDLSTASRDQREASQLARLPRAQQQETADADATDVPAASVPPVAPVRQGEAAQGAAAEAAPNKVESPAVPEEGAAQPVAAPTSTAEPNFASARALVEEAKAATGNKVAEAAVRKKLRDLAKATTPDQERTTLALDIAATRLGMGEGRKSGLEFADQPSTAANPQTSADSPQLETTAATDFPQNPQNPQTAEPIVEHVTKKGKTLRGVVRQGITLDEAKAIDPYAFKKDGGIFIREDRIAEQQGAETVATEAAPSTPAKSSPGYLEDGPSVPDAKFKPGETVNARPGRTIDEAKVVRVFDREVAGMKTRVAVIERPDGKRLQVNEEELSAGRFGSPADGARRPQPGEGGYTIVDALNDLMDLRSQAESQGSVVDDRLMSRIRQQEKLVRDMEASEQPSAGSPEPKRASPQPSANTIFTEDAAAAPRNSGPKWDTSTPSQRREMLNAAGYADGDQARFLSGTPWSQLTDTVRKAIDAAAAPAPRGDKANNAITVGGFFVDTPTSVADPALLRRLKKAAKDNSKGEPIIAFLDGLKRLSKAAQKAHPNDSAAAQQMMIESVSALPDDVLDRVTSVLDKALSRSDNFDGLVDAARASGMSAADARQFATLAATAAPQKEVDSREERDVSPSVADVAKSDNDDTATAPRTNAASTAQPPENGMTDAEGVESADVDALVLENEDATRGVDRAGTGALEGAPADGVQADGGGRDAAEGVDRGGRPDGAGNGSTGGRGVQPDGGVGSDTREVPVRARGKRSNAGTAEKRGVQGDGRVSEGAVQPDDAGRAERVEDRPKVEPAFTPADFIIGDDLELGAGGQKTKYKNNVAAIRILKELEAEGRPATAAEQQALALYVGWGGIPQAFDPDNKDWSKEYAELKGLLTPEEHATAERSTRYAHYTSREIIGGIYDAVRAMGFSGGKMLEPGAGVGNFIGLMPSGLKSGTRVTAVEREALASGIARHLYPQQNIQRADFAQFQALDGYFDVAIGNPPFASDPLTDQSGRKHLSGLSVHNYFFAKSVDMLREGGVLAMVVSNSFMDAKRDNARKYISERTRLLGAIRLPNNAFSKNANTEVTTDIIFLQKRPESEWGSKAANADAKAWLDPVRVDDPRGGEPLLLNPYFRDNPDMMLGEWGRFGSMYGPDQPALVARPGQDTNALLRDAIARLPKNVYVPDAVTGTDTLVDQTIEALNNPPVQEGGFYEQDGKLYQRLPDVAGEPRGRVLTPGTYWTPKKTLGPKGYTRIKELSAIRDTLRKLLAAEMADASNTETLRADLNRQYDAFVKNHGYINSSGTSRYFDDDPDYPLLSALEFDYTPAVKEWTGKYKTVKKKDGSTREEMVMKVVEPEKASKAPIFSKRVVESRKPITKADSPADALQISIAERGVIDERYIGELLGMDPNTVLEELAQGVQPLLFKDPANDRYVLRDDYLSGNVREKLKQARQAGMMQNARALEAVIPEDVPSHEISVRLGAPWVPNKVYEDFAVELFGEGTVATVRHVKMTNGFAVSILPGSQVNALNRWGIQEYPGDELLASILNFREIKVTRRDSDGKTYTDVDATERAKVKASEIKERFSDWAFSDPDRAELLTRQYNDANNNYVTRTYDGSWLRFPGKVPIIKFRRHQRNAIARIVQSRTVLLDHVVGAGKTYTVIAGAMELRRTGLAKKPLIVVPNHLVKQWATDFYRLYPGAKVLTATKKDFERTNRRRFLAKIATGDWDAVVMAHSSYGFIKPSPDFEADFNAKQIKLVLDTIKQVEADDSGEERVKKKTVKQLQAIQERLENRIKALRERPIDGLLDFSQLGVDQLFVDEAHLFKNLMFSTKMNNVRGLGDPKGSQRAYDMFIKVNELYGKNGRGQGVVFATGTPVSNSLAEMYHMMRYLMPNEMDALGFQSFDAWAATYAQIEETLKPTTSGSYKTVTAFENFHNAHELLKTFDQVSDTVTQDDIKAAFREENEGKEFPLPRVKTGRRQPVALERSPAQDEYMDAIGKRAMALEQRRGPPQKGEDNHLTLMSDARKAAMDIRLVRPDIAEREKGGRIDRAADEVMSRYRAFGDRKGTQLVFSDLGTPVKHAKAELKEYQELRAEADRANDEEVISAANLGDEDAIEILEKAEAAQAAIDEKGADWLDAVQAALRGFSVYDDLKAALVERGIPAEEIAFIHDYNTDDRKAALYREVNAGNIRVLLGSTPKLGAGTNVQQRLVALHHLDIPWKPSDVEQREGRIVRQGNLFSTPPTEDNPNPLYDPDFEVEILAYVTKDTLDKNMWDIQERKIKGINQLRTRQVSRVIENSFDEMEMSASEMQAAATGNMDLLTEIRLKNDIKKLEQKKRSYDAQVNDSISRRRRAERDIETLPARIEDAEKLSRAADEYKKRVKEAQPDFKVTIDGKEYTDVEDARERLVEITEATVEGKDGKERKAPIRTEFNGEVYTNRAGLSEAFAEARGDATPFLFERAGQKLVTRRSVVRAIQQDVVDAIGDEREIEIGAMGDFKITVEGNKPKGSDNYYLDAVISLGSFSKDAQFAVPLEGAPEDKARILSGSVLRFAEGVIYGSINEGAYLKDELKRAQKTLADLDKNGEMGPWPDAEKLESLRAQRAELLAKINREAAAKKAEREQQAVETPDMQRATTGRTPGGFTSAQAREVLSRRFGKGIENLERAGILKFIDGPADYPARYAPFLAREIPKGQVRGYYDPDEKAAYVIPGNATSEDDLVRTVMHEVGEHYGLKTMLGDATYARLIQQVKQMERMGSPRVKIAAAKVRRLYTHLEPDSERFWREVIAAASEQPEVLTEPWYKQLIQAIRRFLFKTGIVPIRLTDRDIASMVVASLRQSSRIKPDGGPRGGRREPVMQRREDQTETAAFKRWFGDSKVVDARGKPLVMYHGSNTDIQAFESGRSNDGIYFSSDSEYAGGYGEAKTVAFGGSPSTYPVYLSIKNPLRLSGKDDADWERYTQRGFDTSKLKAQGYDGIVMIYGDGEVEAMAFRPEQIKSATGNRGTFDPEDPRIDFRLDDPKGTINSITQALRDLPSAKDGFDNLTADKRPTWLKALTRQQIIDVGKDQFNTASGNLAQQFERIARLIEADSNNELTKPIGQGRRTYGEIAEAWAKMAGPTALGGKPMAAGALANVMHESTLAGIDPSMAYDPETDKATYDRLRSMFTALPDEAQQLYRDVRDAYAKRRRDFLDAIVQRVMDSEAAGNTKAAMVNALRAQYESATVQGPYFPLSRFGDFYVVAENAEGRQFIMTETQGEQRREAARLRSEGFDVRVGKSIKGLAAEMSGSGNGFLVDVVGLIEKEMGEGPEADAMKDGLWQMYLQSLPELSVRKKFIHRKGTPGFSKDALKAFASQIGHGSKQLARVRHAHKLAKTLRDMKQHARIAPDPNKAADILTALDSSYQWMMRPDNATWANRLTNLGFAWYLGVTPAAAAVNLTQLPIVTLPMLAAKHGWGAASGALGKAMSDYLPTKFDKAKAQTLGSEFGGDMGRMLKELEDSGAVSRTMSMSLMGMADANTATAIGGQRVMRVVGKLFHEAEVVNREITAVAAYRLARAGGKDHAAATQAAYDAIFESHFDYSSENRAEFMRGNVAKVILLFKQYSQNMSYFLVRNLHQSMKGATKEERREAATKLWGTVGMTAAFSGTMGLPLVGMAMSTLRLLEGIFGDDDEPWDVEAAYRNWLNSMLGQTGGNIVAKGVGNLTGADIASRTSLGELWFRRPDRELEGEALAQHYIGEVLGPVVGIGTDWLVAAQLFSEGELQRGFEKAVPKFVRDISKTIRFADEGAVNMRGDPVVSEFNVGELALQALGLAPANLGEQYDQNNALKRVEGRIEKRRRSLIALYVEALQSGDGEGVAEAMRKIAAYNMAQPTYQITQQNLRQSIQSRARYSERVVNGVGLNPKLRQTLMENVSWQ